MDENTPEPDLREDFIDLKARWYAAEARCRALGREEAAGEPYVPRNPPVPPTLQVHVSSPAEKWFKLQSAAQMAAFQEAQDELVALALELRRHPWRRAIAGPGWDKAEIEACRIARERYEAGIGAGEVALAAAG